MSRRTKATETSTQQLTGLLSKYDPHIAALARRALSLLRRRIPGSFELVYDNYNALAIALSPNERSSAAVVSVAVYPRWVSLFFAQGARLRDPHEVLQGNGKQMRHIVLQNADDILSADVDRLIGAALKLACEPFDPSRRRTILIKARAVKQRPRRVAR